MLNYLPGFSFFFQLLSCPWIIYPAGYYHGRALRYGGRVEPSSKSEAVEGTGTRRRLGGRRAFFCSLEVEV